jgi:hypothetical protein
MKSSVFWDIGPCSPLKVNRRFGGTYRLHLQGRISQARYQREIRWQVECQKGTTSWYQIYFKWARNSLVCSRLKLYVTTQHSIIF